MVVTACNGDNNHTTKISTTTKKKGKKKRKKKNKSKTQYSLRRPPPRHLGKFSTACETIPEGRGASPPVPLPILDGELKPFGNTLYMICIKLAASFKARPNIKRRHQRAADCALRLRRPMYFLFVCVYPCTLLHVHGALRCMRVCQWVGDVLL